eukprot:TRINITY_DN18314_c0_g2_i4.p1 TRINITY_DN18314_c0_g2~~TRINITY_DN18314_c0_g2_i4.p1  ORF type:complete len:1614 (+),score=75.53 TRINITY_DN18314_c0_g2_i4:951-5792(+)
MPIGPKYTIHADSLSAILIATSHTTAKTQLQRITADIYHTATTIHNNAAIHWTKSHVGHPYNELADTIANHTATENTWLPHNYNQHIQPLLQQHKWHFLHFLNTGQRCQYPTNIHQPTKPTIRTDTNPQHQLHHQHQRPTHYNHTHDDSDTNYHTNSHNNHNTTTTHEHNATCHDDSEPALKPIRHNHHCHTTTTTTTTNSTTSHQTTTKTIRPDDNHHDSDDHMPINIATANVKTLRRPQRRQHLQQLTSEHNLHIIAVQEACCDKDFHSTKHYHTISTDNDNGSLGCQMWIARTIKYGKHTHTIQSNHIIVNHQDPRRLFVTIQLPKQLLYVCCVHSPHTKSPMCPKAWWKETKSLAKTKAPRNNHHTIILGDFNTDLQPNPIAPQAIGQHHAPNKTAAHAHHIYQTLQDNNLYVPATYFQHQGSNPFATWHHINPDNTKDYRIDHIAMPIHHDINVKDTTVNHDIPLQILQPDHNLVQLQATIRIPKQAKRTKPNKLNLLLLDDDKTQQQIRQQLQQLQVPWNIEPTQHANQLQQHIQSTLTAHLTTNSRPPAPYMTTATYQLTRQKAKILNDIRNHNRLLKQQTLMIVIGHWKQHVRQRRHNNYHNYGYYQLLTWPNYNKNSNHRYAMIHRQLQLHDAKTRRAILLDKSTYKRQLLNDFHDNMSHNNLRDAFQKLNKLKPYRAKPLPLYQHNNIQANTPERAMQQMSEHYRQTFQGEHTNISDIDKAYLQQLQQPTHTNSNTNANSNNYYKYGQLTAYNEQQAKDAIDTIPTPAQLTSLYSTTKQHKAPGPDNIAPAIYKKMASTMSQLTHPLICKAIVTAAEPVPWQYHTPCPIPKTNTNTGPANTRPICLANTIAKTYHRHLRQQLNDAITPRLRDTSCAHRGTIYANQTVQNTAQYAANKNLCHATVYLDLKGAFDSASREILFQPIHQHQQLVDHYDQLRSQNIHRQYDFPPNHDSTILQWYNVHQPIQVQTANAHAYTHYNLKHNNHNNNQHTVTEATTSTAGTKQGDPVADLLFNALFNTFINDVHLQLQHHNIGISIDPEDSAKPIPHDNRHTNHCDTTYVDDATFSLHTTCPHELISQIQHTMSIIYNTAKLYHFQLNLKTGKTQVSIKLRGKHTNNIWQQLQRQSISLDDDHIWITFQDSQANQLQVSTTRVYKHLGTLNDDSLMSSSDIKRRCQLATTNIHKASAILSDKYIHEKYKLHVITSLLVSSLSHHAPTWIPSPKDLRRLRRTHMQAIQKALRHRFPTYHKPYLIPYNQIYATGLVADISHHLCKARLAFFARIAIGPNTLKALLNANYNLASNNHNNRSFLHLISNDIQWLQKHNNDNDLPDIHHDNITTWYKYANSNARRWKRILRRTMTNVHQHEPTPIQEDNTHPQQQDHDEDEYLCPYCGKCFPNKRDTTTHMTTKHRHRTDAYNYATGSKCKSCNRQYHTIQRLRQHLQRTKCLQYYKNHMPTPTNDNQPEPTTNNKKPRHHKSPTYAALRYLQHHGPLQPPHNNNEDHNNHNNPHNYNIINDDHEDDDYNHNNIQPTVTFCDHPTIHIYDCSHEYNLIDDDHDNQDCNTDNHDDSDLTQDNPHHNHNHNTIHNLYNLADDDYSDDQ